MFICICRPASSEACTFNDCVFVAEMNRAIMDTEHNYENMMYKEVVRTGFFEMQVTTILLYGFYKVFSFDQCIECE